MRHVKIIKNIVQRISVLLVSAMLVSCGAGGGDRAGVLTYTATGTVSGYSFDKVTMQLTGDAKDSTQTDANGNYSFAGLRNGTYILTPSKSGSAYTPQNTTFKVNSANVILEKINATSTANTYPLSGTVSGAVKQGVKISLSGGASGVTGVDGSYTINGLPNGSYIATPSLDGYTFAPASLNVSIKDGPATLGNFVASKASTSTYSITGTVSGAGSNSVTISLSGASTATTTTTTGSYAFSSMPNGTYTATPSLTGYTFSPASSTVTINGGNVAFDKFVASIIPPLTYSISGSAVLQGVTINLSGGGSATTDAHGVYTFSGLANGSYTLTPSKTGFTFTPGSVTVAVSGANITNGPIFIAAGKLNDTGITASQCYTALGSDALGTCSGNAVSSTQDGMAGRDVTVNNPNDGKLGFSFTKVCNTGSTSCTINSVLGINTNDWGCTLDNVTGLMWENKNTLAGDLHDWAKTYTNDGAVTDANFFVTAVNKAGLCGYYDWRLPTRSELQSIVDYGVTAGSGASTIDANWFPNTQANLFWSSSPYVADPAYAWVVYFGYGTVGGSYRTDSFYVRLVRAGQ